MFASFTRGLKYEKKIIKCILKKERKCKSSARAAIETESPWIHGLLSFPPDFYSRTAITRELSEAATSQPGYPITTKDERVGYKYGKCTKRQMLQCS